jgi:hypothetical protein
MLYVCNCVRVYVHVYICVYVGDYLFVCFLCVNIYVRVYIIDICTLTHMK